MQAYRLHRHNYRDYIEVADASNVKLEYVEGEIYAMAGGTPAHAALAANVTSALAARLGDRCQVFSSDLRVRSLATNMATYPDVTVVCGPLELDPESRVTVVNPTLVVEVLSDATEDYDLGEKRVHYETIPSLQAIVTVSHRRRHVRWWTRSDASRWRDFERVGSGEIDLLPLDCRLTVAEIYRALLPESPASR